ncbi:T9SS C-terminal target domain-containing protein [Hymenobacter taeanensis]|uniref:T9SS C-terminal target domain-containing protein n=1 Tax=Hymenobacter taeanensis TaxID=2735321 RepID=A0A6M6BHN3_9BACT|nr:MULTISPECIES: T9SS C-terminal target domain-containing protein [Hymenobacter]QJX47606.1 T9SS C-terminal target domain-containing protein [Hymenobacter taeanensis]UOQ82911.1 T9SS C-terminal target domain-containing protein [Hymenobacter sp. 5414T-23]
MKKNTLSLALAATLLAGLASCSKEDTTPAPNIVGSGGTTPTTPTTPSTGQVVTVGGSGESSITTNTTWSASNKYLLKGFVYVKSGATLTIEAGTIIKGDKDTKGTLIVEPGAKIVAIGTAEKPIVFTSNQPRGSRNYGDWGGLIIAGNAPVNSMTATSKPQIEGGPSTKYGGDVANDNSGTLQYVRIEFGGVAFSPDNEVNGLTLAAVGSGTTIDHIQVSYSGDDSYEWFGGTVNAKYLVSHRTFDDDFDTDNGFSGKIQFAVSLRDPLQADQSGSKAFESDNDSKSTTAQPQTSAVFSNVTAVGPVVNTSGGNYSSQYTAGAHIRRNSSISILNSVIMGYPTNVLIDNSQTAGNAASGNLHFKNNIVAGSLVGSNSAGGQRSLLYIAGSGGAGSLTTNTVMASDSSAWGSAVGPLTWLKANGNKRFATSDNVQLLNPFSLTSPSFIPRSASPIVATTGGIAPDFTDSKVTDSFFTKVAYVGAFSGSGASADNWLASWTNFDPQQTDY